MKITKNRLKEIIAEEISKLNEEKPNPWAICTASVGREDEEKYERCVKDVKAQYDIKEDREEEMMANMARAEAARRAALAAKKAKKKNNEACGELHEQEGLELDDLIEPVKTEIERSINDLSDQLMAIGMDEDGTIDVLNLLLTKLIADLEAGFVGPPA